MVVVNSKQASWQDGYPPNKSINNHKATKKYWLTWNGGKETTNNKVSTLTNPISTFYNIHILQMLLLSNAYTIFTSHERHWGNRTYQMFYNFLYQKSIYLISLQSLVIFTDFFQPTKEITNELLPYNLFSSKNDFFFFSTTHSL